MIAMLGCTAIAGCVSSSSFECDAASDCVDAGVAGSCEPTGFCSFPDATCPSMRRYGQHAGNGLGGMCVDDDGTTGIAETGDDGPATTITTSASSASETMPLDDEGSSSAAVSVTDEGSTTTSGQESTTDDTVDPETSTSTGEVPTCSTFVDDFEDETIDPSWTQFEAASLVETDGELRMHLTAAADGVYPGVRRYELDLLDGWVRVQPGLLPGENPARLFLAVGADEAFTDVLYVMAEGPLLVAMREQVGMPWEIYEMTQLDPEVHAWWQIRSEGDEVHFETSADGVQFEPFASVAAPFALGLAHVAVASTNYEVLPMDMDVSVREVAMCTSP